MSHKNTPESFWVRVTKLDIDACWEWQGARNAGGYGIIMYHGQVLFTHRLAYHLAVSPISLRPTMNYVDAEFVLHDCDNPSCCNPKHLHLGTHADNGNEAYERTRLVHKKGPAHVMSVLTEQQESEIRVRAFLGATLNSLAIEFNVSASTIGNVTNGRPLYGRRKASCQAKGVKQGELLGYLES